MPTPSQTRPNLPDRCDHGITLRTTYGEENAHTRNGYPGGQFGQRNDEEARYGAAEAAPRGQPGGME
jgi:hypothetical protein